MVLALGLLGRVGPAVGAAATALYSVIKALVERPLVGGGTPRGCRESSCAVSHSCSARGGVVVCRHRISICECVWVCVCVYGRI